MSFLGKEIIDNQFFDNTQNSKELFVGLHNP